MRKPKWAARGGAWSVAPASVLEAGELDVAALRSRERLTQRAFAKRYGFSFAAVKDWEQRRRTPDRLARVVLTLIARSPGAVRRALAEPKP